MPLFDYIVKDDGGRQIHGIISARDEKEVKRKVSRPNYFYMSAKPIKEKTLFNEKVEFRTLIMFTSRLATLIDAGIPILTAMNILWRQTDKVSIQRIISYMRTEMEEGNQMSFAMDKFTNAFPGVYRSLVRVGESGGALSKILVKLSEYLEYKFALIQRTKSATTYPMIVIIFATLCVFGLFTFVVPIFDKVLSKIAVNVPLVTKLVLGLSRFMLTPGFYIGMFVIGGSIFALFKFASKQPRYPYYRDRFIIKLPIFGDIFKYIALSQFVRSLSILLGAGMPVVDSINIASTTTGNQKISADIEKVRLEIEGGISLHEAFKKVKDFPIMMVEMIGVGEQTGLMVDILQRVTKQMDEDVDYSLTRFLAALEPALIFVVGGMVMLVLLSIYLPIISVWQGLGLK